MPARFLPPDAAPERFDIGSFKWFVRKINGKWSAVSPRGETRITFDNWERAILWAGDWT
jgi:hypothetical protein